MKRAEKGQKILLDIRDLGSQGEGVGSLDTYTVFVDDALPGERVEAELIQAKKTYGRARLLEIRKASPHRVEAPCPIAYRCGGCQIQHLDYAAQLEVKKKKVQSAMAKFAKMPELPVMDCVPSPKPFHYRNKVQLPIQQTKEGIRMGFFERKSHNLVPVQHCLIHNSVGEEVYSIVKKLLSNSSIHAYDESTKKGDLKFVLIKSSTRNKQCLVTFVTHSKNCKGLAELAKSLISTSDTIKGVVQNINPDTGNVILGKRSICLEGQDHIFEEIYDCSFKVSPNSFFQVNPEQAEQLYAKTLELANISSQDVVWDAYCGVGTLACIFAKKAKKVYGTECVPAAIEDAKENAKRNQLQNTSFHCDFAEKAISKMKDVNTLLVNPPRKGCAADFLEGVKKLLPEKILYISCDPATLARDIAILCSYSYEAGAVHPFDMFPQTSHVESLICLTRKYADDYEHAFS